MSHPVQLGCALWQSRGLIDMDNSVQQVEYRGAHKVLLWSLFSNVHLVG